MNPLTLRPDKVLLSKALLCMAAASALAACAGRGGVSDLPHYQCSDGTEFSARFVDDTAELNGSRGKDILYRDAGGQGAQTVYSNSQLRAEFGLGSSAREAKLHYLQPPLLTRCERG